MTNVEFDGKIGQKYDDFTTLCPHEPFLQYSVREILPNLLQFTDPKILEIGTGTGNTLNEIIAAKPESQIIALDESPVMLDQTRKRFGERANVQYVKSEAYDFLTRQDNESFDAIISGFTIHNIPEPQRKKILSQVSRVIKPKGWVIFADKFNYGQRALDEHVLDQELKFFKTIGERENLEDLAEEWIQHYKKDAKISRSLQDENKLLENLGFTNFNLYFRYHMEGVYYAQKKSKLSRSFDHLRTGIKYASIPLVASIVLTFSNLTNNLHTADQKANQLSQKYEELRKNIDFSLKDRDSTNFTIDSDGNYMKHTIAGSHKISKEVFLAYVKR